MEKEINVKSIMDAFDFIRKAAEKAQNLLDNGDAEERRKARSLVAALAFGEMATHPVINNAVKDCARDIEAEQKFDFEISNRAKE